MAFQVIARILGFLFILGGFGAVFYALLGRHLLTSYAGLGGLALGLLFMVLSIVMKGESTAHNMGPPSSGGRSPFE